MAMEWTAEQQKVIDLRDRNILVSAAAGSGKTAVLVERIVGLLKDPQKPMDIDRLLVVTFTKAAASEMRERIQKAVDALLESDPDNEHLQRQQTLIYNAKITTIDSFCNDVLHNYFHLIGLDPNYRVGDEGELKLLKSEVLEALLEEAFAEKSEAFERFVESYATGRDDREIGELILKLFEFSMSHPWPKEWIRGCRADYDVISPEKMFQSPWADRMMEMVHKTLHDLDELAQRAIQICLEPDGPWMYEDALNEDRLMIRALQCEEEADSSWETYRRMNAAFAGRGAHKRLSTKKDERVSEEQKEFVKELRDRIKKGLENLEKQYFFTGPEEFYRDMAASFETIQTLTELTMDFSDRYSAAKREKNLLDFSDMEHLALEILVKREDGKLLPSQAAVELSERFDEIMIDEYQDSNQVQELILNSVAGGGCGRKNIFMVGDVKQSIYRFRMARPELFMEKYERYTLEDSREQRIDLSRNFRSRSEVLESVNYLFRRLMTRNLGGIVYDKAAALYPGAVYPQADDRKTEVLLLDLDADEEAAEEAGETERELEARLIGRRIEQLVGKAEVYDRDAGGMRKAKYGDCVVLLRTMAGWSESFLKILAEMGIPAYAGGRTGYFSSTEIQTVISFLKVIDNPRQDIPLAAVLASPIGNFSAREMALIKAHCRGTDFYGACQSYREDGSVTELREKLAAFFSMLDEFRSCASYLPMHELLWKIFDQTGYADYAAAMPGGELRAANLRLLEEKATAYEETSYRGLYNFIRYIENLQKAAIDYGEASIAEDADTVRIMSIHKSKGLEFPIVFVSGMQKSFNKQDVRGRLVLHPDLGIGCDYVDPVLRCRIPLLSKHTLARRVEEDDMAEELRVLYVALTRAKEKLILTGVMKNTEKKQQYWKQAAAGNSGVLSYTALMGASSYLDWIMPVLLEERTGLFEVQRLTVGDLAIGEAKSFLNLEEAGNRLLDVDPYETVSKREREKLEQLFSLPYPFEKEAHIGVRVTVSELKRMGLTEEEEPGALYREEEPTPWIPEFMKEKTAQTGAARGSLYHKFLEKLDYSHLSGRGWLEDQIRQFAEQGFCTPEESTTLRPSVLRRFLSSQTGLRMAKAAGKGNLYRERQFVVGIPARELNPEWKSDQEVLIQGIIDAWFWEDGEIVLVDYKTDYTDDPTGRALWKKYEIQLYCYRRALEQLTGARVKESILYSFCLQSAICKPSPS